MLPGGAGPVRRSGHRRRGARSRPRPVLARRRRCSSSPPPGAARRSRNGRRNAAARGPGRRCSNGRAEDWAHEPELRETFDLVTARSFARPAVTAEIACGFLKVGGLLVVSEPPGRHRTAGRRAGSRISGFAVRWSPSRPRAPTTPASEGSARRRTSPPGRDGRETPALVTTFHVERRSTWNIPGQCLEGFRTGRRSTWNMGRTGIRQNE